MLRACLILLALIPAAESLAITTDPFVRKTDIWPPSVSMIDDGADNWTYSRTFLTGGLFNAIEVRIHPASTLAGYGHKRYFYFDRTCNRTVPVTCSGFVLESTAHGKPSVADVQGYLRHISGVPMTQKTDSEGAMGDLCFAQVFVHVKGVVTNYYSWCARDPIEPVSCVAAAGGVIDHGRHPAGVIESNAHGQWRVTCTAPSRVTIEIQRTVDTYNDAGVKLPTQLHLGTRGVSEINETVTDTASGVILSSVTSVGTDAGVFTGSGILRVSWD